MKKIYSCDFETRSKVKIKHGLCQYFSQGEALFLGWGDGESSGLWDHRDPNGTEPTDLLNHVAEGGKIAAWNAIFEFHAWNRLMVSNYGWPELKLEQLIDTMAMASAANLPQKLDTCGNIMGMPVALRKNQRGNYLIRHLTVPRKPTKTNPNIFFGEGNLMDEFGAYCEQDVVAERTMFNLLPKLSPYEQKVWELTQRINLRGVPVDEQLVATVNRLREENDRILEDRSHALIGFSVKQTAKITEYLGLPNIQAATVEEALETATGKRKDVLQVRKALAGTGASKFTKVPEIVCEDGTVKHLFVYHGAGTGRWASRGGLNVQNFTRPVYDQDQALRVVQTNDLDFINFLGEPSDYFNSITRSIIHGDFTDADFSSVENRVASWVAGDTETLKLFEQGFDQYKYMATKMYHVAYDDVTKGQRQIAKAAVLGCFGEETLVVTNNGNKKIVDVEDCDLLWDGAEWVSHEGVAFRGHRRVIDLDGIQVTHKHEVFVGESVSMPAVELWHSDSLLTVSLTFGTHRFSKLAQTKPAIPDLITNAITQVKVFDILNAGKRHRFTVITNSGALIVSNCGFGQGPKGFIDFAAGYGVTIDEDESKQVVRDYRAQYPKIVKLWYLMGDMSKEAVNSPGKIVKVNKYLSFKYQGDFLLLKLPSGRKLHFYKPKVENKETPWGEMRYVVTTIGIDQYTRQYQRIKIIGANFYQSAVQGIARDLLANSMFSVEDAGCEIRSVIHDEILADRNPDVSLERFCELMCEKPEWAKGLPLAAEGWNGDRYRK